MSRRALLLILTLVVPVALLGRWAQAEPEPGPPTLPTLPPIAEQLDGLYDADGCLRTGVDEVDCSVRAEEVDEALADGGAGETRQLAGFVGSRWLGEVTGHGPVVLEQTVATEPAPTFAATGLVRNDGEQVLASISVEARLLDAGGSVLDVVEATSPVHDLRPGEPAPFRITAAVAPAAVATIEWSALGGSEGDPSRRELSWTPYWERPAGGRSVDLYLHRDPPGERPYLLFGGVAGVGEHGVEQPEVVVAWLDPSGLVQAVATSPVRAPSGGALSSLDAGGAGDVLVVRGEDPPAGGEALVWVQGS